MLGANQRRTSQLAYHDVQFTRQFIIEQQKPARLYFKAQQWLWSYKASKEDKSHQT